MLLLNTALRAALISCVCLPPLVAAHTWVEQLMVIAPNGTMIGQPGYPRANVLRTNPNFGDSAMTFLIPPNGGQINVINANQSLCRPEQSTQSQTSGSPRLKAAAGQAVALRYQENGHVSLPQNQPGKPSNRGANFVYYTTKPSSDEKFLQVHRQWTADGTGGDGRGKLISTQNFDDGQCYQINSGTISTQRQAEFAHIPDAVQGASLWCQTDVQIPADAQAGTTVTLYWVWDWPTLPGTAGFPQGKQEIYTTCMDIDIVAASTQAKAIAQGFVKQDFAHAAIADQFADIGNPSAIKAQTIPFSGVNAASSSASGAPSSSSVRGGVSVVPTQLSSSTAPSLSLLTIAQSTSTPSNGFPVVTSQATPPSESPTSAVPGTQPTHSHSHRHSFSFALSQTTPSYISTSTALAGLQSSSSPTDTLSVAPIQMTPLSVVALTASSAGELTVTVHETVTAMTVASLTQQVTPQLATLTATETDYVTVFETRTAGNNQATTATFAANSPIKQVGGSSTTQRAYQLRARNPFYIVPPQDQPKPSSTADAGCSE